MFALCLLLVVRPSVQIEHCHAFGSFHYNPQCILCVTHKLFLALASGTWPEISRVIIPTVSTVGLYPINVNTSVCLSVCVCVCVGSTLYLRNRLMDRFHIWHDGLSLLSDDAHVFKISKNSKWPPWGPKNGRF